MCKSSRLRVLWTCLLVPTIAIAAEPDEASADRIADRSPEEVIVIGSSIARVDGSTTAPLVVIDEAQIRASGLLSVGDILQDLPSQANAINTLYNNGGDGSTRVSLRSLGAQRSLVLLNGRHLVAGGTGADLSAELNLIPLSIVSRIEVLKRSASAAYGSDAIGGVVNIVTRADLEGSEADAYAGTSAEQDGTSYGLSLLAGDHGERGDWFLAASYVNQGKAWAGDRPFSAVDRDFDYDLREAIEVGSISMPNGFLFRSDDPSNPGNALYQAEVAANCPSGFCTRDGPGAWRDVDFNTDLYNFQPENYLATPGERYGLFGSGRRTLGGATVFGELMYTERKSAQSLAPAPLFSFQNVISVDSIYNPYGLDLFLNRRLVEAGRRSFDQDVELLRAVAGMGRDMPGEKLVAGGWTWELAVNYGRTSAEQTNLGDVVLSRLNQATGPSFVDDGGTPRCGTQGPAPGPDDDDIIAGCVPADLLGLPGSVTTEMLDFLTFRGSATGHNEETVATARLSGRVVETPWDGHLSAAVGAEYRRVSGDYVPDAFTRSGDTSGNFTEAVSGDYDVRSAFAELSFVPVTDRAWVRSLEFNAAARPYRYNSFASGTAWDTGMLWRGPGGFSVRGSYSTGFRGASIPELYSEQFDSFGFGQDPCDAVLGNLDDPNVAARCAAEGLPTTFESEFAFFVPTLAGGNRELREETGKTFTAGIVLEPTGLPGLVISVDYFDIDVRRVIAPIAATDIFRNCYFSPEASRRNCDLVTRDPTTGFITFADTRLGNHDARRTSGYDATVSFERDLGAAGRFVLLLDLTYLDRYEENRAGQVVEGTGVYDLSLVLPRLKANSHLRWERGPIGVGVNLRSISEFTECELNDCSDPFVRENRSRTVSSYFAADLLATYQFQSPLGASTLRLGVNNVSDEAPPIIYGGFYADSDPEYDFLGRFYYTSLTFEF